MNATQYKPGAADFEALANAEVIAGMYEGSKKALAAKLSEIDKTGTVEAAPVFGVENGTVIDDTFEAYLGNKDHYSTGSIAKLAMGNPLDFLWDISEGVKQELEKFKDRSYFDLGRFLHLAVLEPEVWSSVIVEPAASRASHDGLNTLINFWEGTLSANNRAYEHEDMTDAKPDAKKAYIEKLKITSGITCIEEKNHIILQQLRNRWSRYKDGLWFDIMQQAITEVSIYADDYKGLPMRIRPDGLLFKNQIGINAVISVKTTSASNIRQAMAQTVQFGYHIKEAAYQDIASHVTGVDFKDTITVMFQTVEPFNVAVFMWPDAAIRTGRMRFDEAIEEAKVCLATGEFPGWEEIADDNGIIDITLPEWASGE